MALLLIVVLSAAAAGALGMIGSERRTLSDQEAHAEAYDIARSAYDRFIANPAGALPAFTSPAWTGPDSAKFTFLNGHAYVRVQRLVPSLNGGPALYIISSRGLRTTFRSGNTPSGERIFAQYARWNVGLPTLGAWTALGGLLKSGGSGIISGADECGKEPSVAGVGAPTVPGYVQTGGASVPSGSPNILDMGTQANANSMITIDWPGMLSGAAVSPDIKIPGDAWPSFADPAYWPVIFVDQAAPWSLPNDGRGLLIVKNDMTIGGSLQWDGIVLVGGSLTSNGNNTIDGAVVTGLNAMLGQVVLPSDVGSGNKSFRYNSCNVENAARRFRGLAPLRNTTVDNWPSY